MKNKSQMILDYLDEIYPNAHCELNYTKDYELLIATILSAQCTDKRVNMVTKELWQKYDINSLAKATSKEIEMMIHSIGSYTKKATYIIEVAKKLVQDYDGHVPNNREYLETLPGVGRKTTNVVLSNIYGVPSIAVDTHVERVSKRLGLAYQNDTVLQVEHKLMKKFPKERWIKLHHQFIMFGRYQCKAIHPECHNCKLKSICHEQHKTE